MKCHFCNGELVWGCDYSFDDYGLYGEGIIAVLHCDECGAIWEGYLDFEKEREGDDDVR